MQLDKLVRISIPRPVNHLWDAPQTSQDYPEVLQSRLGAVDEASLMLWLIVYIYRGFINPA